MAIQTSKSVFDQIREDIETDLLILKMSGQNTDFDYYDDTTVDYEYSSEAYD